MLHMNTPRLQRSWPVFLVLAGVWIATVLVAGAIGAVQIPPLAVARIIAHKLGWPTHTDLPAVWDTVVWQIRLPRVILGSLVGAALGLAGAAFQGLLRNPLADPYVLGVSSGASLGAVLALALGLPMGVAGLSSVPLFAFAGALAAIGLVFVMGRQGGRLPMTGLLLAGVALSSFLSSAVSLIVLFSGERMGPILFWLMGGLSSADWPAVLHVLPYLVVGGAIMVWHARALDALAFGEATAGHLGVEVERVKLALFIAASLLTASAVAVSGVIGFVGLVTPHIVRLLRGPSHRWLLPIAMALGAIFLVAADTLARTVLAPQELPVGAVTALCGAPFFLYILHRQTDKVS